MEYRYAIIVVHSGFFNPVDDYQDLWEHTEVIGVFDDKALALKAIRDALNMVVKHLKECEMPIRSIEEKSDGWMYNVDTDCDDGEEDTYTIKAIRFQRNTLEKIDF